MKKIAYMLFFLMTVVLGLTGCYEDKGNYKYSESTAPTITGIPATCDAYFGSPLSIPVTITYPAEEWKNVAYEWRVNLKVISTDKDLNLDLFLK